MPERDERLYLVEILAAIDRILAYTADGREAFFADTKTQDAVILLDTHVRHRPAAFPRCTSLRPECS